MKRFITIALAASFGIAFASVASAAPSSYYSSGDAANGIAGSRHNLGSLSKHVVVQETTEICVFCHTPHHTNKDGNVAPLWNRSVRTTGYTAYGTTIGGTTVGDPGSVTLACLSCHDGVTTLDNLVNAPGKGGVTAGGSSQGWNFYYGTSSPTSLGTSITIGSVPEGNRLNIGTDLSNDHPVSVVYNSSVASLRPESTYLSSINLYSGMASSASTFDSGNLTRNLWAVKGYIKDNAQISDLLRAGNKVECSSCHDPHFANATGASPDQGYTGSASTDSGLFLRRVGGNVGSGVCRTCHNK